MKTEICPICRKEFKTFEKLSKHLWKKYKLMTCDKFIEITNKAKETD